MKNKNTVVIIGAGLTGIMAARTLKENGVSNVLLVDKGKSVGGRLATRRMGEGIVDHGAQFFTVRSKLLQSSVSDWLADGKVKKWFGENYPRYTSTNGMNALAKFLAEEEDFMLNTKINRIQEQNDEFVLVTEHGEKIGTRGVILTAPAPQSLELLNQGEIFLAEEVFIKLSSINFNPCLVALLSLTHSTNLDILGHLDTNLPSTVERIVDHKKKGISLETTVSIYMKNEWSSQQTHESDEGILAKILLQVPHLIDRNGISSMQLKRWKYAEANTVLNEPFLDAKRNAPLLFAGDAFLNENDSSGRTRFESAFLSGIAVGEEMVAKLRIP